MRSGRSGNATIYNEPSEAEWAWHSCMEWFVWMYARVWAGAALRKRQVSLLVLLFSVHFLNLF